MGRACYMVEIKVIAIAKGEDFMEALEKGLRAQGVEWGTFEEAMGQIKAYDMIRHMPNDRVERVFVKNVADIQSVSGQVKNYGSRFEIELKVKLGQGNITSVSGKLLSATAASDIEIAVRKVNHGKMIIA